ncbi:MAG TPA: penicillin acylase family protein, partial [Chloroflexota bacterium]|nr:penicillin acylase family protein [Chloroflexota bacterium]
MALSAARLVADLAAGKSIAEIASTAGVSVPEAKHLWSDFCASKVPPTSAELTGGVSGRVEILRDSYGVPHIYAQTERDLFYGLGFAMAQDRLWLMDYLRRKATGRLAELLGESYLRQDELYRILDFETVCTRNYSLLADRWRQVLDGMAGGINRVIDQSADHLPIEFDLLGYRPEPWSPTEILVALRYQWWGLSGRLQQITSATQLDRALGNKVSSFTKAERDDMYIVPDGLNAAQVSGSAAPVRDSLNVGDHPHGSNNWVVAGSRTHTGKPLLANDPHYSYSDAHGNFYPCHLNGAGHSEAGFVFLGTPGMLTGANDQIAWGFTNNGATIRDLYAEEFDTAGTHYRRDGKWETLAVREVAIAVKGKGTIQKTIRATAHGPIVNDVIPKIGDNDPPLALRWVGFEMIDDVQALLEMNLAGNWAEFRAALRNWACSVTNFIYGDREGNVGYQMSARVPLRKVSTRGIRPAWDPAHEWQGYIPFDGNPRLENPPDGIVATANQRPINPAYRWPLYGAYAGGTRQARILQLLRAKTNHDAADFRRMQYDSKSLIAEEVTPRIVAALERSQDERLIEIGQILAAWDNTATVEAIGPTIFEAFIHSWTVSFAEATVPDDQPTVRAA